MSMMIRWAPPAPLPSTQEADAPASRSGGTIRRLDSAALLAGAREVVIEHRGEHYRLRHTRNDKLILTK